MEMHNDDSGFGLFDRLRKRGFWIFFTSITVIVFILLTAFDFLLAYFYRHERPGLDTSLLWDIGINLAVGLLSAGFAWKYNGEPWINRPDTAKLDLDK